MAVLARASIFRYAASCDANGSKRYQKKLFHLKLVFDYPSRLCFRIAIPEEGTEHVGCPCFMPLHFELELKFVFERNSIVSKNPEYNDAALFLPAAGYCDDCYSYLTGVKGYYWSASLVESKPSYAYSVVLNEEEPEWDQTPRYLGLSIRAVR